MAFAGVTIDIVDKASRKLRGINDQTKKLTRSFTVLEKRNKGLTTRFNSLGKAIAAVGLVEFGRRSINTAASFEKLNLRLRLLTEATGQFSDAQAIAARGQKLFGISAVEATEGVTNITSRLLPLGVSLRDIETTFIGFNTAAKLGGSSAIEASNAFRQLAQALGSGRLAGDEFRSVSEQVPLILKPLSEELGVSTGALKELAAQGKLTSDVVIRALSKLGKSGAKDLKAILENDPTQVFKNLQNEIELLQISIGKALLPATKEITGALTLLTSVINSVPPEITSFVVVTGTLITAFTVLKPLIVSVIGTLKTLKAIIIGITATTGGPLLALIAGVTTGIIGLTRAIIDTNKERDELNKLIKNGTAASLEERIETEENTLAQLKNADARGKAKRGIERQIKEQKELIELLKEEAKFKKSDEASDFGTDTSFRANRRITIEAAKPKPLTSKKDPRIQNQDIVKSLQRQIQLKKTEDKFDRDLLERKFQFIDSLRKANEIQDKGARKKALQLETQLFEIDKQEILNEKLREQNKIFQEIGDSIESDLVENIRGAITGTQSLGSALTNVLNNLRNRLLDKALQNAFSGIGDAFARGASGSNNSGGSGGNFLQRAIGGIGSFVGGLFGRRENGGPVSKGRSYLVGERGPEMFTPSSSGRIVANNELGGTVVNVNVDASGSSVSGNTADAQALGAVIGAAVQAQLVKEKRAGGLLAR